MSNKKRKYTLAFKQEAVALWETGDQPARIIEQELGITPGLLSKWRRGDGLGRKSQAKMGNSKNSEQEIRELKKENARLRQEREILKKASSIGFCG